MHRPDGRNFALAAILLGVSAVTLLNLLSDRPSAIIAVACGVLGVYVLIGGVYLGWWTPATALERRLQPRLVDAQARMTLILDHGDFVMELLIRNAGWDNLDDAYLNIIVPETVSELKRSNPAGDVHVVQPQNRGAFTELRQRFWEGNVSFPGRMPRIAYFRATARRAEFPLRIKVKVSSPALDELPEFSFDLTPPPEPSDHARARA